MQDKNPLNSVTLEQEVNSVLSEILQSPNKGRYRCYEIARLLGNALTEQGYEDVSVKTGKAQYDVAFLDECFINCIQSDGFMLDVIKKEIEFNPPKGKTRPILHSWVDMGEIVVDYHHSIDRPPSSSYESLLFIKRKDELAGKASYLQCGKEFSIFGKTLIYIPPIYFTQLGI